MSTAAPDIAGLIAHLTGGQPQSQGSPQGEAPDQDPIAAIKDVIQRLHQIGAQEGEPEDQAAVAQCIAALTKLLAKDQQEKDGLLAGKFSPRALRKTA